MVENAMNDYRALATAYIERGCGDAKELKKLTEEIISAAEWADFTELRASRSRQTNKTRSRSKTLTADVMVLAVAKNR